MKKIKCLFERTFHDKGKFTLHETVTPGLEWALTRDSLWTIKYDGTACMFRGGQLFARYDAKKGKTPPIGFEPCGEPDEVTGHHPGWVPVVDQPQYKWHIEAMKNLGGVVLDDGTYELCGPHFQSNPHRLNADTFIRHGMSRVSDPPRCFADVRVACESTTTAEGFVVYRASDMEQRAKMRRADFGFPWPMPVTT